MADVTISSLNALTPAAGTVLYAENSTTSGKIDYATLAQAIIEQYNGSTLAGSLQSVQSALDSMNKIRYEEINSNDDLDNLMECQFYRCKSTTVAGSLLHCPTSAAFGMIVLSKYSANSINNPTQIIVTGSLIFTRTKTNSGWTSWYKFTGVQVVPESSEES